MRIARGSSLLAFGLSFFCTFTTASTVDLNATAHRAVPGDFNGDGLVDALYQPQDATQPSGIFFRDTAGNLSIPGQVWDAKYLGLDWNAGASVLHTADFRGLGRADVLLQAAKSDGKSALLFSTPDGQFLNIGQTLPNSTLGFDWSADSHLLYTGRFDGGPQSEVLLQSVSSGGLNGIVHPDSEGQLTQLVETWPDNFLGIPWDASAATLYVGDFNGDGQDDLLVQMNQPDPTAQGYFLLLADPAGKFSTIKQSWGANAFGADWNPTTHRLSVQTIDGVTSLVLTSTDGGSNYVFQADAQGGFSQPAAQWKGPETATQALKSRNKTAGSKSIVVPGSGTKTATQKPVAQAMTSQMHSMALTNGNSPATPDSTGELSGSGGVSGGAGSYSIPIAMPPGIAGMQPALSINYSSKGGNGDLGMGWSLSGLSAIHRCPSTKAQDGVSAGVNYTSTDRLCLDGQHLIVVSGNYGAAGAIYRTELDSGVLVKESGAIGSANSSFEVDYQDGRAAYYGTKGSFGVTVVPSGAPAPLIWDISEEEDLSGNNILYTYALYSSGELHLQSIAYTGNSTPGTGVVQSTGTRTIVFYWQTRPDVSASYLAGGLTQETQVLTNVTINVGGTELREYDISYAASGATGRSLLQSAQECGFDSSHTKHCLPATNFTWQNGLSFSAPAGVGISETPGGYQDITSVMQAQVEVDKDYFGDGRKALFYAAAGVDWQLYWAVGSPSSEDLTDVCDGMPGIDSGDISEDFNSNGMADVACSKGGFLNIVSIAEDGTKTPYPTPIATSVSDKLVFGDFTGDGMEDVITSKLATNSAPVPLVLHPNNGRAGSHPDFSHGATTIYSLQVTHFTTPVDVYSAEIVSQAGDLDGNGISDLFLAPPASDGISTKPYKILFMDANGATPVTFASLGLPDLNALPVVALYWTFMDINGDGLPDFVFVAQNGSGNITWQYQLNLGNRTFATTAVDTHVVAHNYNTYKQPATADIDNDGQQEILIPDQLVSQYCWTPKQDTGDKCPAGTGDDRSIYKWNILKFVPTEDMNGNISYTPQAWGPADQIEAPLNAIQTGDLDGNGLTAVFADFSAYYLNGYFQGPGSAPGGYDAVRNTAGAPDLMTGAVSGLGRQSLWQYQSLRDLWQDSVPSSGTASFYNAGYANTSSGCAINSDPTYYCFATSMYVVSDYQQSDGVSGMRDYHYGYQDAVYNGQGRGFQGFSTIKEYDLAADTTTTTVFNQDFPLSGKPQSQTVRTFPYYGSKLLSNVSYQWQQASTAGGCYGAANVLLVQPNSVTANTYDLHATGLNPNPYISTVTNYVTGSTDGGYDSNGNNTYKDVTTTDYSLDGSTQLGTNETTTTLTYRSPQCGANWTDWVATKSVRSIVSYTDTPAALGSVGGIADGSSITRNASYTPTSLRKLQEEQDDLGSVFEKDTTYGYDGFGNVNSVTVASGSAVPAVPGTYGGLSNTQDYSFPSRTTNTTYTTDGYFVSQVSDPLGYTTTIDSYDLATGQPTSVHDVNGVASTYVYDGFGRKIVEVDGPMPEIDTSYTSSGSAILGNINPPSLAAYVVNTTQAGYPSHSTYYDLYGKQLREAVDSDRTNTPSITDTAYDNLGRVTSTSEPFFHGSVVQNNTVDSYDFLNRPTQKTDVEGVVTTYAYNGLTTTITTTTTPGDGSFGGAVNRVDVETHNSLGKLLTVENAQGTDPSTTDGTTQFRYDAQGNPVLIQDAKLNQTIATYNLLGQKTQVADPDQGTSTYAYDVLGEMLQQTDAKAQVTMQTYDLLGRMTTRTQAETQTAITAIWCYDGLTLNTTTPTASGCTGNVGWHARGKLSAMGQADGYSETYNFDTSSRPYRVHTTLPGGTSSYDTNTSYDQYSRVATTTYPGSFPDTQPTASAAIGGQSSVTVVLDNTSNSASVSVTGTTAVSSTVFNTVYTWTVSCTVDSQNGPPGAPACGTIATPNAPNTTFTAQDVGTYTLTLTVTDGFLTTTSNTVTVTVQPGKPGRPGVSSDNQQDLTTSMDGKLWTSWAAAAGTTYYKLFESIDGGNTFNFLKNETTTSDYFPNKGSFTADYTYEYEVQACDNANGSGTSICGPMSVASPGVIVTYPPQPVTNVTVQNTSYWDGSFDVSWTAPASPTYVTQYNTQLDTYDAENHVYVWDSNGCSTNRGSSAPATTCRVGPKLNGNFYSILVQACNVNACTGFYPVPPNSNTNVEIILAPTNPHLSPNPSTNGNFTYSWTRPSGLGYSGGFNVYQSFNNGSWTYLGNTSTTSWAFTGKNNGSYRYMVTGCINGTTCSGNSSPIMTETVAVPPGTATISASPTTVPFDGSYGVNWSATGPVSSWTVEKRTLVNGSWSAWNTNYSGTATNLRVDGALTGSYQYRAQGCNSVSCTAWTAAVTVSVSPDTGCGNCSQIQPQTPASASNGSLSTTENTAASGTLSGTGSGTLTFAIVSQPAHGSVTITSTGTGAFTYTPAQGYVGADAFTFDVSNANGTSSAATESITVTAPVGAITLPSSAGIGTELVLVSDSTKIVDFSPDTRRGEEREAELAPVANEHASPSRQRRSGKKDAFWYAPPVYVAYANNHLVPATGTQTMARLQVAYGYTSTGYLNSLTNALSPTGRGAFWALGTLNAHGAVKTATLGNGVAITNSYADPKGRITGISTVSGSGTIQSNTYTWYNVGNLATRQWQAKDPTSGTVYSPLETFTYDVLNRLSTSSLSGASSAPNTVTNTYDVLGNVTCKSDVVAGGICSPGTGGYTYGGQPNAGPHAVTAVAGTVNSISNPSYGYDPDGNMANRAGTNVKWNSLNLPTCMDATGGNCSGNSSSSFSYAPDKHRYQQISTDGSGITETTTYVGSVEFVTNSTTPTTTVARHMLTAYGENILSLNIGDPSCAATPNVCFNYTHSDHLGGVDAVTDVNGNLITGSSFGYDAFGGRRDHVTGTRPTANQVQMNRSLTHRGFTKHEMLDNVGLVHMNGRVYDPALGRFLSVDPVYQAPTNMQSLNPYSYVLNNPLSLTDPSGYDADPCGAGTDKCSDQNPGLKAGDTAHISYTPTGSHIATTVTATVQSNGSVAISSNNPQVAQSIAGAAAAKFGGSNGQENQNQGAGSTLATSQGQGGGASQTANTTVASVNEKSGAPADSGQATVASLGNPEQSNDGGTAGKKDPFDIDLLTPGDKAYGPAMTYVRTPETANDFLVIGHGNEPWGTRVTDEINHKDLNDTELTARIIGSQTFRDHPEEVMLMICYGGKNLSALAAKVSQDLSDAGYHVPVSGPSMHGNIGNGIYFQDQGGRQRTFLDGKEVLGAKSPEN